MRILFGMLGLLVVLAVTGLLLRQQMKADQTALPSLQIQAAPGQGDTIDGSGLAAAGPASAVHPKQPLPQQYKQALDGALQARPMPDDL